MRVQAAVMRCDALCDAPTRRVPIPTLNSDRQILTVPYPYTCKCPVPSLANLAPWLLHQHYNQTDFLL